MRRVFGLLIITMTLAMCGAQESLVWDVPAAAKKMKNPTSFTGEALVAVVKLYDEKCVTCHGAKGASNGPAANSLSKEPSNFTNMKVMNKIKDGELFWKITKGRAPMPGFEAEVSQPGRWQLVNYVRYLSRRSQYQYLGHIRPR